jgi:two-component system sensor histidine kinase EvgS
MFIKERTKENIYLYSKNTKNPCSIMHVKILFFILFLFYFITASYAVPGYKEKSIIFGGDSAIPPYEFIDKTGVPAGFSVELTKAIAQEIGWNVEIRLGNWHDIRRDLESGRIDVIQRASHTEERSKIYKYSIPYHEFRYTPFINSADMDYFRQNRLEGMYPVAHKGSFVYEYLKKNYPGSEIKETERLIDAVSYISVKRNSYTLLNKYLGIYLIKEYGIENVVPAGDPLMIGRYHYATLKNNKYLISGLNEGLAIIKMNGKFETIYNKWFGVIENEKIDHPFLKIITAVLIPILLMYLIILAWSWFLNKKIKIQTARLSEELNKHKFSEKALMESEERSRLIIENAPLGIFHFNLNGEITTCNDSFIKIMGSSREKLIGLTILQLPDQQIVASIKSAIKGQAGTYEGIYTSITGGKSTHIRAMFTPIKLPDGTLTGGLGIVEDNTARKKYEEALVTAKDTAESASSIKSDFLANMSHEVRTPLNGILGMLQLIQTTGVNEEQANYVNIAIKSGMRLTRLLNDILDLSRVESDKLVLTENQFSLKGIFSFIEERYATECEEKGVNLLLTIDEGTPDEVVGDETRIRQILVNLVSNAVKFTKTGNIVVNISAEDVSCYGAVNILISVKDTGIGIADDMLNQIFEPFRQGENSYRRTFQGAGLGLTLVKHLVNLMNGTIRIDSKPGIGTSIDCVITVKLPENHAIVLKPVSGEKLNKCGNLCTILIAEDERINRLALKRILEKSGYRILEAENGIEAIKILEAENPDCILMDIQMPEMDGIEATKIIRDKQRFGEKSAIPIIALTAYTMPEDREKINAAGLDDYISKPVNMDYLIKSISKFVTDGDSK